MGHEEPMVWADGLGSVVAKELRARQGGAVVLSSRAVVGTDNLSKKEMFVGVVGV